MRSFNVKEQSLINLALELKSNSQYKESLDILLEIHKKRGEYNSVINGLVASVFYESKDYKKSSNFFRTATILNPKSELVSLGLFHSLIEIREDELAMKEILRYLSEHVPDNYKITIKELFEEPANVLSEDMERFISNLYKKYSLDKLKFL